MENIKYINISKEDFEKIDEKDVMFITNPGRMGDEDGSYFIVKNGNVFNPYRVSGWMYSNGNEDITLDKFSRQFPLWKDMWNKSSETNKNEKYTYIYMGFGNGLSIDNSIYEEFEPYFIDEVNNIKEKHGDTGNNPSFNYPAWEPAFIKMCNEKKYTIKDV
jgi:hypothetical protein